VFSMSRDSRHERQNTVALAVERHCKDVRVRADRLIALIDAALSEQTSRILHHAHFQAMEARWRGLALLLRASGNAPDIKIRILSANWGELARSMERATEFDQSRLFELIYSREFGMPGGEPFGLLIGDYEIGPDMKGGGDPISALGAMAGVAAAAFCPFIAAASPQLLQLDSFVELSRLPNLERRSSDLALLRWQRLRQREDTRFVGLVAPRILVRRPYASHDRRRRDGFSFRERLRADGAHLNWGNGAFAFAVVAITAFLSSGWFADLRGAHQDADGGGMVSPLEPFDSGLESHGLSQQPPVEVRLTSLQEKQISDHGLIPVSTVYMSNQLVFNSNQSLHDPPHYASAHANQNVRLSGMLQYVLCASRFAHYLKVILRDEVGRLADARSIQAKLSTWLSQYTVGNEDAGLELRRRYPLRMSRVSVHEQAGKPGSFACTVRLQPHFQLDNVDTSFQLIAESSAIADQPTSRASA